MHKRLRSVYTCKHYCLIYLPYLSFSFTDRPKQRRLVPHYQTEGSTTLMTEEGGFLSHRTTTLLVPNGALRSQTEVTLSSHDHKQLEAMLASAGWDKTVSIVCAVHIECETSAGRFRQPVQVRSTVPEKLTHNLSMATSPLYLLHSNYLRKWDDITHDAATSLSLSDAAVSLTTDRTGWLAVAVVDLDRARVAAMAMQALSISPATFQVCIYGQRFPDNVMQITVAISPNKEGGGGSEDNQDKMLDITDQHKGGSVVDHTKISFPYLIQVYPGEQLRCRLKGSFEPDGESGETDLDFQFKTTQSHECLSGKFVRLTVPFGEARGGKMVISRHVAEEDGEEECWEDITDVSIHLSSATSASGTETMSNTSQSRNSNT